MLTANEGSTTLTESTHACRAVDQARVAVTKLTHLSSEGQPRDVDELLLDSFARARRRFRGAIVALNERTMITNAAASELLQPGDRRALSRSLSSSRYRSGYEMLFELANGLTVRARCYPVDCEDSPVGTVVHLSVAELADGGTTPLSTERSLCDEGLELSVATGLDPALLVGWSELTDSERNVAELVGQGLSNRQAGRRLFMSRHTVDYHLRRVFRKLGIKSRVELARVLGEHYESLLSAVAD